MWINIKTGRPAWLIEQDQDGGVIYSLDAPGERARHHTGAAANEFFAAHREATADELDGITPRTKVKAERKPKDSKPAPRRASKGPRKPRKAAPVAHKPPAADKPPAGSPGPAGGEAKSD